MKKLSHVDNEGRARMVNVGDKDLINRIARAEGFIMLGDETVDLIKANAMKKGDVLAVAEIAGVQAAKQTSMLIPLCHNIPLDNIKVVATVENRGIRITADVSCSWKTGVEMEALTAVSVSLLTVYDMCKAVDKNMVIKDIRLVGKTKQQILV